MRKKLSKLYTQYAIVIIIVAILFGAFFISSVQLQAQELVIQGSTKWFTDNEGSDTFTISTAEDLIGLADLVNSGNDFSGKTIIMANDIDLSEIENWATIGLSDGIYENEKCFMGNFDGDNHIIKNFKMVDQTDYTDQTTVGTNLKNNYGIFSITDGSIIKNLTVEGDITLEHPVNHERVTTCGFSGGIIGIAYSTTIENCHFRGTNSAGYVVGGIVGKGIQTTITNCSTKADITGSYYVGGIAGQLYGNFGVANASKIEDCSVEGNITANIGYSAGGIVGSSVNPYMRTNAYTYYNNCITNEGSTVTGADCAGGIAGEACAEFKNCINHADVTQKKTGAATKCYAAGIVPSIPALVGEGIKECINYGSVSTERISNAAGIICAGMTAIKLSNVANLGDVSAESGTAYGLICGTVDTAEINNAFNIGSVSGASSYPLGQTGIFTNVYYDSTLGESTVGEAKTTEEFKNRTVVDLLNGDAEDPVWFQNVNYPDFAVNMTPVEGISIDEAVEVGINKETTIKAVVTPEAATNKGLSFTSSDEEIATVTADGKVTGKKAGEAEITVTALYDGTTKAVCKVTVKDLDKEAAQAVIDAIKAIDPAKATVEQLKAIQDAYNALTPDQKKLVDADSAVAAAKKKIDDKLEELEKETTTVAIKKGTIFIVKGYKYTVTDNLKENPTVTVTGYNDKKLTKINIPATVTYQKVSFKVTAVAKNAFKGQKKAKTITIGNNVETIGASAFAGNVKATKATLGKKVKTIGSKAFSGDKKLKTIVVKSTVLKKVGGKAFSGIYKKATIKVPAKKLKAYKKLLKGKGQKKTVKIKK